MRTLEQKTRRNDWKLEKTLNLDKNDKAIVNKDDKEPDDSEEIPEEIAGMIGEKKLMLGMCLLPLHLHPQAHRREDA